MGAYGSKRFREDLEALRSNDITLQALDYEGAAIGDEGARALGGALRGNRTLKRLRLGQCNISAAGLAALTRALHEERVVPCRLRKLELSSSNSPPEGNPIGDQGAKHLAELLEASSCLRHVTVAGCGVGDEGASSIARALQRNTTLKTLDLSCNSIGDVGVEQLGSALGANTSLQGLSLWSNRIFHSGAEALANGLASNTTLKWLGLGCNHIGDEGVKALAIALISNAKESGLVWLALGGNDITDRGAEHLAVALKAQHSTAGGSDEIDGSSSQTSLTEQIRAGGLRPMLELGVTPSHVSIAVDSQSDSGSGEDGEGGEGGDEVFCVPLESLGLGGNRIGDVGAASLADGLKTNTRLLSLGLADNRLGDEGASALAGLIRETGSLQRLVLSGNDIHDEGGEVLVASLTQNNSLKALYLAGNLFGDRVGKRCQEVIGRHNSTLQVLDLHDTRMSTPAVSDLVEDMRKEGVLRSLGSQPLVMADSKGPAPLPETGNMLEMETWQPQDYKTVLQRHGNLRLGTTAPSQRFTTVEALGSLPPPEESAQALLIKPQEHQKQRRRSSISDYFRRKLSITRRKDSVSDISVQTTPTRQQQTTPTHRPASILKRQSNPRAIELHPLTEEAEEEEDVDGGAAPVVRATREGVFEEMLRSPTVVVGDEEVAESTFMELPRDDDETQQQEQLPSTPPQRFSIDLDSIERSPRLRSLTIDRPKPPANRRPPSRQRSPSPSPAHSSIATTPTSTTPSTVGRVGGITSTFEPEAPFVYDVENRMKASAVPIPQMAGGRARGNEEKPLKEQWSTALRMRVGMLKMGGFLHSGFDAVTTASSAQSHDYTHAHFPRNASKNRSNAPLPPSHSRVKLQLVSDEVGSDYINANYVGPPDHPKAFIITQLPLESTQDDLWRMMWEQRVGMMVVIGDGGESSWLPGDGETHRHSLVVSSAWRSGSLCVGVASEEVSALNPDLVVRTLTLESLVDQETDTVKMFHFSGWPEKGTPQSPKAVAQLYRRVLSIQEQLQIKSPVVVMSEHGAGRAGCFCTVGVAHQLMTSSLHHPNCWEEESNIVDLVIRGLRKSRGGLVETQRQFEFCHRVLEEVLWGASDGGEGGEAKKTSRWRKFSARKKSDPKPKVKKSKKAKKDKQAASLLEEEEEAAESLRTNMLY